MYNPKADLRQYDRYIRRKRAALALALLMTLAAALLYMGIGSIRLRPLEILRGDGPAPGSAQLPPEAEAAALPSPAYQEMMKFLPVQGRLPL